MAGQSVPMLFGRMFHCLTLCMSEAGPRIQEAPVSLRERLEGGSFDVRTNADAFQFFNEGRSLIKAFAEKHKIPKENFFGGTNCFILGASVDFFGGKDQMVGKKIIDIGGGSGAVTDSYGPLVAPVLASLGAESYLVDTAGPSDLDFGSKYTVGVVRGSAQECIPGKNVPEQSDLLISCAVIGSDTFLGDTMSFLTENAKLSQWQIHYINKNDAPQFTDDAHVSDGFETERLEENGFQVLHNGFDAKHKDIQYDGFLILKSIEK